MRDPDDLGTSNTSSNLSFEAIVAANPARRRFIVGGLSATALALLNGCVAIQRQGTGRAAAKAQFTQPEITFASIASSKEDMVRVPAGYRAAVLIAWGDPISDGPAFKQDASQSADDQLKQSGMHHDGMQFFPFAWADRPDAQPRAEDSQRGLICCNHEYADDGLLHPDGMANWNAAKVAKSQAAHGVSIIEVQEQNGRWGVARPSKYARRITPNTPARVAGPAAGSALMKSALHPDGVNAHGILNNCANGYTPWGTYLTCDENFTFYVVNQSGTIPAEQKRYNINDKGQGYRWHEFDERFDAAKHPNEANQFGWVTEIDPFDPHSVPVKRTALGRFKHEGAMTVVAPDGRVVVYMGDDERFEYVYKFVSRDRFNPADRRANFNLLDHGTLYVARYDADGKGAWLPLIAGGGGLTAEAGFPDQASVCVKTRQAADIAGATKMDRPERVAIHPVTGDAYVTLTNNEDRGKEGKPGPNAANPRAQNIYGHILHWRETGADPCATAFEWDLFVQCGDPAQEQADRKGNIKGDIFACPDGLWFDPRGVLWIQTDAFVREMGRPEFANIGNNQMLCADVTTGQIKRFLTAPRGAEVTGITMTPDMRTLFVNIQHPGESNTMRNDPANPKAVSSWPDGAAGQRPRSATVVIQKEDGNVIGT